MHDSAQALRGKKLLLVGFTLFSMFFGAGNLIFPPFLGAQAGTALWPAFVGFAVSAIGLPIAGVLAVAQVGLVGWLWRTASTAPVGKVWEYAAGATPMHWTTASLSAAGNGGSTTALWAGMCAGLVLAVVSFAGAKGRG